MGVEKTRSLILKVLPYRESSLILDLFTEKHGLVHGIAKGARKKKSKQDFLERGFLIELILYIKPHRDLNIVGTFNVLDFFQSIRSNLVKAAIRDAAFETILAAITVSDFHPELFEFFLKFLSYIQSAPEKDCNPFALWLFYYRFSQYMGFGFNLEKCIICQKKISSNAFLNMGRGGLICNSCSEDYKDDYLITESALYFLRHGYSRIDKLKLHLDPTQIKRITGLLANYCRYHFDTHKEYKALSFLDEITTW